MPPQPAISAEIAPTERTHAPVEIGVLLPLSGPSAGLGLDFLRAMRMALDDLGENPLALSVRDTEGTAEGAALAAGSLLDPGIRLIIGPIFGDAMRAAAAITRARDMPMVAFTNQTEGLGNRVFSLGYQPQDELREVLRLARARGHARILFLGPDNDYGRAAGQAFSQMLEADPLLEAVGVQYYQQMPEDIRRVANEIAEVIARLPGNRLGGRGSIFADDPTGLPPIARLETGDVSLDEFVDAVLIADHGAGAAILVRQLARTGAITDRVQLLGLRPWQFAPEMMRDRAFLGAWYPASSPEAVAAFERRFLQAYAQPPHPLALLAYDAVRLAHQALVERNDVDAALTDRRGYLGYADLFRLRPEGIAERRYAILQATPLDPLLAVDRPAAFSADISPPLDTEPTP